MSLQERVRDAERSLSGAERRVAQAVLAEPAAVGFGTVADLARRSGAGAATVVRLAAKLGYEGYGGLQAAVREELTDSLRPAAQRIREPAADDVIGRTLEADAGNVRATLENLDPASFNTAVAALSRRSATVFVASGDSSTGIAMLLSSHLRMLRDGVRHLIGSPVAIALDLATASAGDLLVVVDFRRYDRWLLEAVDLASVGGMELVVLTDSPLSPLARNATAAFAISGRSAGPFDSQVGALVVVNALLTGVARRLRAAATARLDTIEAAWRSADLLTEGR